MTDARLLVVALLCSCLHIGGVNGISFSYTWDAASDAANSFNDGLVGSSVEFTCSEDNLPADTMIQFYKTKVVFTNPLTGSEISKSEGTMVVTNGTTVDAMIVEERGGDYTVEETVDGIKTEIKLTISNLQPEDSGTWACRTAVGDDSVVEASGVPIYVYGPPEYVVIQDECCVSMFPSNADNRTVDEDTVFWHGNVTSIVCQVSMDSDSRITGHSVTLHSGDTLYQDLSSKFPKTFQSSNTYVTATGGLRYGDIQIFYEDEDFTFKVDYNGMTMRCAVSTDYFNDAETTVTLNVKSWPVDLSCKEATVYGITGKQDVNIECSAKGNPAPTLTWTLPDNKTLTSPGEDGDFKAVTTQDGVTVTSTLTIKEVKEGYHGDYKLEASNEYGMDSVSAALVNDESNGSSNVPTSSIVIGVVSFLYLFLMQK